MPVRINRADIVLPGFDLSGPRAVCMAVEDSVQP